MIGRGARQGTYWGHRRGGAWYFERPSGILHIWEAALTNHFHRPRSMTLLRVNPLTSSQKVRNRERQWDLKIKKRRRHNKTHNKADSDITKPEAVRNQLRDLVSRSASPLLKSPREQSPIQHDAVVGDLSPSQSVPKDSPWCEQGFDFYEGIRTFLVGWYINRYICTLNNMIGRGEGSLIHKGNGSWG